MKIPHKELKIFQRDQIDRIPQFDRLSRDEQFALRVVSAVLPFRVNNYVLDELIDWDRGFDDPICRLVFPQRGMLLDSDFDHMADLVRRDVPRAELREEARKIQYTMNPHPSKQWELNVPAAASNGHAGIQHKYRETVLFFPAQGQICHSYCTYCFRWGQFVGIKDLRFAEKDVNVLTRYLRANPAVTDVIFTGGDPLTMKTEWIEQYVNALLAPDLDHVQTIRFGSKADTYWPYRYLTDPDADALIRLYERIVRSGKHLAIMAHHTHPRELGTATFQAGMKRILGTGAVVRSQAPIISKINDRPEVWEEMWRRQVRIGIVPYYMFIERDTGPNHYFGLPLERALRVYEGAWSRISGVGRTVRGPIMSATPGKVMVESILELRGEKAFLLRFMQARAPELIGKAFLAKYDPDAMWLTDLEPFSPEDAQYFTEGVPVAASAG